VGSSWWRWRSWTAGAWGEVNRCLRWIYSMFCLPTGTGTWARGDGKREFLCPHGSAAPGGGGEVLSYVDPLAGGSLLYVEEKRETGDGRVQVEGIRLRGGLPMRLEALCLGAEEAARWEAGKVHVAWEGAGAGPLCLFPLVHGTWADEQAEVYFLNRSLRAERAEYLSYSTGRVVRGEGYEEDVRAFLSRVVGKELGSEEVGRLRDESRSEAGEALASVAEGVGHVGPYRLCAELGKGGMGVVYLAEQESLHRQVALKALPFDRGTDPVRRARFLREVGPLRGASPPMWSRCTTAGKSGACCGMPWSWWRGRRFAMSWRSSRRSRGKARGFGA